MSHTDATDPIWVRLNAHRGDVRVSHCRRCSASGGAACDLPVWPVGKHDLNTWCHYSPTGALWRRVYGGSYASPPSRKPFRRQWFNAERTAQRSILRSLTREANSGGEIDEDVVDNRQTHRHGMYGGGWWD